MCQYRAAMKQTNYAGVAAAVSLAARPMPDAAQGVRGDLRSIDSSIESCTGCHGDLPPPDHDADFYTNHAVIANLTASTCGTCHDASTCENCHAAASKPGFHPPNCIFRHRAEAYARDLDCAKCHSTETFRRACHENTGVSSPDVKSHSYHDANPLWLLSHGNAARQGLDNCASCHQQSDCPRCHSAKTGWHVNPHGPDFDPERLGTRSLLLCSRCRFSDPRPE